MRFASFAAPLGALVLAWRLWTLVRAFIRLGAVSPETAVPAAKLGVRQGAVFRRLIRQRVIVSTGDEHYYLDQARYREWRSTRRRRALILLSVLLALILIGFALGWLRV